MLGERIRFLDGLKGLACILVMWHHFILGFLPECFYGNIISINSRRTYLQEIAQSPFTFFINGNYMVALFCMISGIVLSYQVMNIQDKGNISKVCIKRYPRLVLPMVPIALFVYMLSNLNLFSNRKAAEITESPWLASWYTDKISFSTMVKSLFYTTWFVGNDPTLSNAYWVMNQIFLYSFLVIILSCITWNAKKNVAFILCIVCAITYMNDFGLAFVLGFFIAYTSQHMKKLYGHNVIGTLFFLVGIILGGYPSTGIVPDNGYRVVRYLPDFLQNHQLLHIIGATFTIYGIYNIVFLQKLLENKSVQMLGRISYAVYLLHIPLMFSIGTYSFLFFGKLGLSYIICVIFTFIVCNALILGCAVLYSRYFETVCNKMVKRMVKMIYDER